jgi:hypothetical protein
MEQSILVYLDLEGVPLKVGQLWARYRGGLCNGLVEKRGYKPQN